MAASRYVRKIPNLKVSGSQSEYEKTHCLRCLSRRLSRALHRFRASCVRLRQERHLSVAVQVLCTATQIRPMERLWSRWRRVVRHCQSKAVFKAWTTVMRRRRRLQDAKQRVVTAKDRRTALNILTAWRKKTGASMLAELSNAWATIGPVRKAVSIMRGMATEVRAEKYRRRRRLRYVRYRC